VSFNLNLGLHSKNLCCLLCFFAYGHTIVPVRLCMRACACACMHACVWYVCVCVFSDNITYFIDWSLTHVEQMLALNICIYPRLISIAFIFLSCHQCYNQLMFKISLEIGSVRFPTFIFFKVFYIIIKLFISLWPVESAYQIPRKVCLHFDWHCIVLIQILEIIKISTMFSVLTNEIYFILFIF
jgi:hypothetical protein